MPGNRTERGLAPWQEAQLRATTRRNRNGEEVTSSRNSIPSPSTEEVEGLLSRMRTRSEAEARIAEMRVRIEEDNRQADLEQHRTVTSRIMEEAEQIERERMDNEESPEVATYAAPLTPREGQSWANFFEELYSQNPPTTTQVQPTPPEAESLPDFGHVEVGDEIPYPEEGPEAAAISPEPGSDEWLQAQARSVSDGSMDYREYLQSMQRTTPSPGLSQRTVRSSRTRAGVGSFGQAYGASSNPFDTSSVPTSPPPQPRARSWDHSEDFESNDEVSREQPQYQSLFGNVEANETMTTVSQVFGQRATYPTIESHPLIVGTNLAGVEIELENIRNAPPRFRYWETHQDGSLRNQGMEFVCSSPWGGQDLYEAALEIDGYLFNAKPDESWRCSTHVHVDVRDLTVTQLKRLILAYIVFERILFKCSGWHRYKNNFCVALGFAQEQLAILSRFWGCNDTDFLNNIVRNWDKYSSLNLLPMSSFGSVEFRISEAKWRKGKLIRLVNRFLSLKELAVEFTGNSDEEFIDWVVGLPIHRAIRKGLPKSMPDYEQDVEIGFKLAHDVVSMSKIRRRHIYTHVVKPQSEDDTRRMRVQVEAPYWRHIKDHLRRKLDGTWLVEDRAPSEITFAWLFELQQKCNDLGITFDSDWFQPVTLARQHRELWQRYRSEQLEGRRQVRGGQPDLYEEPDEDEDSDDEDED